jgi:phosphate transport system substrate-binding protein
MKKIHIKTIIKFSISILLGAGISFLFMLIFLNYFFPVPHSEIETLYFILACILYLSGMLFFIFWNTIKSKKIYFMFFIPIICISIGIGYNEHQRLIRYKEYTQKLIEYTELIEYLETIEHIATLSEPGIFLWQYWPFNHNNLLVKLEEASTLTLVDNLPILDGATAFFPVYAAFVQTVYCEYSFSREQLLLSRTERAYENLLEGKVDIIFCLEPSNLHLQKFHDNELQLKLIPIGREAFVFFVNIENPVNNLTIENIRDIYSGEILNWRELNGYDHYIMAFQRPKNSGSQTIFEKIMGNINIIEPRMELIPQEMLEIINRVANYRNFPNAIGYSFLHYSTEMVNNDQIKLLAINGIFPSKETIQDGSYPFSENIYAVYIESDDKNENIEPFIDWILSRQGQTIISRTGYITIVGVSPK